MRLTKNPLLSAATALFVLALAAALWAGISWYAAAQDSDAAFAQARDDAVTAARQGVQNLNTLDYRDVDKGLAGWEDSATGELLKQLKDGRTEFVKGVKEAKTVTTAEVESAALTELNEREGKANVLVAVRITVTPAEGKPQSKQSRMLGELTRTPQGWKLSALAQAPVGDTAGAQED